MPAHNSILRFPKRLILLASALSLVLYLSSALTATTFSALVSDSADIPSSAWLKQREDGTVIVRRGSVSKKMGHPIRQLMAEARQKFDSQVARQSKTFEEAVANYRAAYGKNPPRGFDAWFAFVQAKNVRIVDDYSSIDSAITPFLALPPKAIAARLHEAITKEPFSYHLDIKRSGFTGGGERYDAPRPTEFRELLDGMREWFPEDFGMGEGVLGGMDGEANDEGVVRFTASDHDLGSWIMGEEFHDRMVELAEKGEFVKDEELVRLENVDRPEAMTSGLLNACSPNSPAGIQFQAEQDVILTSEEDAATRPSPVAFIRDPGPSYNFCKNPMLLPYHGAFSYNTAHRASLLPQFVLCKFEQSPQLLMTPLEAFSNTTKVIPWMDKTMNKVFWRGSATGDHHSKRPDGYNWRNSHRIRLHTLTNAVRGHTDVLVESSPSSQQKSWRSTFGLGSADTRGEVHLRRFGLRELNDHIMDVGLTQINQCEESDGTCDEMKKELKILEVVNPEQAGKYKYAIDIDGNGWSSRFHRLVASGKVVFKTTIYPEWNSEVITPWLHYVPISVDLSDLYHTSTFFVGTPEGKDGHDELAHSISDAGVKFANEFWRWEDMQAYMFRILLEYRRMMASDRDRMSHGGKLHL